MNKNLCMNGKEVRSAGSTHLIVRNFERIVRLEALQVPSNPPLPNTLSNGISLGLELAIPVIAHQLRTTRIRNSNLNSIANPAQVFRGPRQRTAGTNSTAKAIKLALKLGPNLRAGSSHMGGAIRGVIKLVSVNRTELLGQPCAELDVVVRIGVGLGGDLDELCAGVSKGVLLLLGLGLGDDDDALVTAGRGYLG